MSLIRPRDRDTIRDFVEHLQAAGKSRKTIATYPEATEAPATFTAAKGMPLLEELRREYLEDYFADLDRRGNKPSTVRNAMRALRAIFKWMIGEDMRQDHPFEHAAMPRIPEQVLPHCSDGDVLALLNSIPNKATDLLGPTARSCSSLRHRREHFPRYVEPRHARAAGQRRA